MLKSASCNKKTFQLWPQNIVKKVETCTVQNEISKKGTYSIADTALNSYRVIKVTLPPDHLVSTKGITSQRALICSVSRYETYSRRLKQPPKHLPTEDEYQISLTVFTWYVITKPHNTPFSLDRKDCSWGLEGPPLNCYCRRQYGGWFQATLFWGWRMIWNWLRIWIMFMWSLGKRYLCRTGIVKTDPLDTPRPLGRYNVDILVPESFHLWLPD